MTPPPLNEFQAANCAFKLDGYMRSRAFSRDEEEFEESRQELLKAMRSDIACIEGMTMEQYRRHKKNGFRR
jgi:hypothetical protein